MARKIIIGSDHAGFALKNSVINFLATINVETEDKGAFSEESSDFPDYAAIVAKEVARSGGEGILICGTGIGMCMAANKMRGIRAALCTSPQMAKQAREHNNANILCLGGRIMTQKHAKDIVQAWLDARFLAEERFRRRIDKISKMESGLAK